MHELPTMTVTLSSVPTDAKGEKLSAAELSRRLRMDQAAVFTRIENDKVVLDMRTVAEEQIVPIISAIGRVI